MQLTINFGFGRLTLSLWIVVLLVFMYLMRMVYQIDNLVFILMLVSLWILAKVYNIIMEIAQHPRFIRVKQGISQICMILPYFILGFVIVMSIIVVTGSEVESKMVTRYIAVHAPKNNGNFAKYCLLDIDQSNNYSPRIQVWGQIKTYENSTPVKNESDVLVITDPDFLVSLQICTRWEISVKSLRKKEKELTVDENIAQDAEEEHTKNHETSWKKLALTTVFVSASVYKIYTSYRDGGAVKFVVDKAKETIVHLFRKG